MIIELLPLHETIKNKQKCPLRKVRLSFLMIGFPELPLSCDAKRQPSCLKQFCCIRNDFVILTFNSMNMTAVTGLHCYVLS